MGAGGEPLAVPVASLRSAGLPPPWLRQFTREYLKKSEAGRVYPAHNHGDPKFFLQRSKNAD